MFDAVAKKKVDFNQKLEQILEAASKTGADTSLYYVTTLDRYNTQIKILEQLKASIAENGMIVEKEYVKNRKNIVVNPAVTEYNKTTDSANRTVTTLMKIIKGFAKEDEERDADYDPLMAIINGDSDGDE